MYLQIIGYTGGALLGIQLIPQIIKIICTKSTKDLSYIFLLFNVLGLSCMCFYGIANDDKPLYVPVSFSLFNTIIIVCLKCYYDNKTEQKTETVCIAL